MNKKIASAFVSVLLGILLVSNVLALGITPGGTTYMFEPNAEKTFSFSVVNSEHKDLDLSIIIRGDLNNSISLSENKFKMAAGEADRRINVILKMPNELSPGTHISDIVVTESQNRTNNGNTFLGTSIGVVTQIYVIVPYPGKYLVASLNVIGPDENGNILFVFPVINRGEENIEKARVAADIYDSQGKLVAAVNTDEQSIAHSQRGELIGKLSQNLSLGNYRMSAIIYYDGQTLSMDKTFSIGEPLIELNDMKVQDFNLGGIAKFEMTVENKWSEEIKGAYSRMMVYNSYGEVLAEISSPPQDIPPLSKAVLVSYWDSSGAGKAVYDAVLSLNYEGKSNEKKFKLDVEDNEINIIGVNYVVSGEASSGGDNKIIWILLVVIVVLAIINTLWFMLLRKRLIKR